MERIVLEIPWEDLFENDLINTQQHGFQFGRSCVTKLLECFHQWTDDLNMGKGTYTIYRDFSKEFDYVSHSHLLYRLHHYGIRGNLLLWLKLFLTNRRQRVVQQQHNYVCIFACCVGCTTRNDICTCAFPNLRERHSGIMSNCSPMIRSYSITTQIGQNAKISFLTFLIFLDHLLVQGRPVF